MGSILALIIIGVAIFFALKKMRDERKRGGCAFCSSSGNCPSQNSAAQNNTCPSSDYNRSH